MAGTNTQITAGNSGNFEEIFTCKGEVRIHTINNLEPETGSNTDIKYKCVVINDIKLTN
jgi:hypothetical protein